MNGLYYLAKHFKTSKVFQENSSIPQDQHLWHQRLAHPFEKVMPFLFPNLCKDKIQCDVCHLSKSVRLPFDSSLSRASNPFEIIHSDIWGPVVQSFDGYMYFVTFVDDFTRITWLYLLKFKSEFASVFQDFHKLVGTQFSSNIHILRSDNGIKYMSNNIAFFTKQVVSVPLNKMGLPREKVETFLRRQELSCFICMYLRSFGHKGYLQIHIYQPTP